MLAVDTNVVVRFLTGDDARQAPRASALFRSENIWLAKTVLLETEWVLRRLYRLSGEEICAALEVLMGLPNVQIEDAMEVAGALRWAASGLDFADALHLASKGESREFITFDEKLVKGAKRLGAKRLGASGVALLHV